MNGRVLAAVTIVAGVCLSGCAGGRPDIALNDPTRPADLTLEFHVVGDPTATDRLRQTSMYVLEPDRRLRVAIGYRSPTSFYPQIAKVLTADEYDSVVRLVYERRLMAEPTSPIAEAAASQGAAAPVLYCVDLSGWGMVNRYETTPEESPPTEALLARLVAVSGLAP